MISSSDLVNRLTEAERTWSQLSLPDDLFGLVEGLTKLSVTAHLITLKNRLVEESEKGDVFNPLFLNQISTQLTNIQNSIANVPGNPSGIIPGLLNQLYSLSTAIVAATPTESVDPTFIDRLRLRLSDNLTKTQIVSELLERVKLLTISNETLSVALKEKESQSAELLSRLHERDRTAAEISGRLPEIERKISAANAGLEASLNSAKVHLDDLTLRQSEIKTANEDLEKNRELLQKLLEDANRIGLAGAFKTRKAELDWPIFGWITLFLVSVGTLGILSILEIRAASTDWHNLLFKLPFSVPFIWLAWFSVKQYGFTRRLQEDYSFKVAAAMSFQGYKNEVHHDADMTALLRRSAIENFSANPLRIYEKAENHGSPLHEALASFDSEKLKLISEIIGKLNPKK